MANKMNNEWNHLVDQYLSNRISRQEFEDLLQKLDSGEGRNTLTSVLKDHWEKAKEDNDGVQSDWDAKFEVLMEEVRSNAPVIRMSVMNRKAMFARIAAAIIIILGIGAGTYFLFSDNSKQEIAVKDRLDLKSKSDLLPGTEGAILTLGNGEQIVLDSAGNGTLAKQGSTKVIYKNGQIVYDGENGIEGELIYNTMTTPKGKQYQLSLADGSKVWLNAASSIRYPVTFTGKERKVEITGEAYFEIAHDVEKPFRVLTNNAEVQVLGTHFNVNAYNDEAVTKTTLLEGSVKISLPGQQTIINRFQILKPGQQAQVNNNPSGDKSIKVLDNVDTDIEMAWKNGYFSFDQTDLATIMRQIARWYEVEIVYEGEIPNRRFTGEISRTSNASEVLKILEESKVHVRIEGKKIIVQP